MAKLTVFKAQYVNCLREKIKDNEEYYRKADNMYFCSENKYNLVSSIEIDDTIPSLIPEKGQDALNAILVYEYLHNINETIASDPRLWVYLSHVVFCDYVVKRWKIEKTDDLIKKVEKRFFVDNNARSIRRNAISRLWWATHLTVEPWLKDERLSSLFSEDKYYFTRVLMADESISSDLVERPQISSSPILFISVLHFIDKNRDLGRKFYRQFLKEIVLTLGYKKMGICTLEEIMSELDSISVEVKSRLK